MENKKSCDCVCHILEIDVIHIVPCCGKPYEKLQEKIASREALKTLNKREQQLKEALMKDIINLNASNKETIRTLAFLINKFKNIKGSD